MHGTHVKQEKTPCGPIGLTHWYVFDLIGMYKAGEMDDGVGREVSQFIYRIV